jgi:hypothetical protein
MFDVALPWICYDAIDFIESQIGPSPYIFEYGSGASTLFWLKHNATLVSVEHDAEWHAILKEKTRGDSRLDYRLLQPGLLPEHVTPDASDPEKFHSADAKHERSDFTQYVTQIDEFPDASFDVVVIDGRSRTACIKHAAPKVKAGGYLVLDNSSRERYLANTQPILAGFELRRFGGLIPTNVIIDTTDVYIRRS